MSTDVVSVWCVSFQNSGHLRPFITFAPYRNTLVGQDSLAYKYSLGFWGILAMCFYMVGAQGTAPWSTG